MSDDYKVQYNIKCPNQDLVNARADTVEELKTLVADLTEAMPILAALGDTIRATTAVVSEFPKTSAAPATGGKVCAHGVQMRYQEGMGKNGKPYAGWFCDTTTPELPKKCATAWKN